MAITFPRTDVMDRGFADALFELVERQELSRMASGAVRGKSLSSAIWTSMYTTRELPNFDATDFEAVLHSLDGVLNSFYGYDVRRPYPRAYPDGVFSDTGKISTLNSNNKALRLKDLMPNFVLSRGDYLAFNYGAGPSRALHQVMENVVADANGLTPEFEVRPHIRPGAVVNTAVVLKKPSALFVLEPNSVKPSAAGALHSVVSFNAIQLV